MLARFILCFITTVSAVVWYQEEKKLRIKYKTNAHKTTVRKKNRCWFQTIIAHKTKVTKKKTLKRKVC